MLIPVRLPIMSDTIKLSIWDKPKTNLGTFNLNIKDIQDEKYAQRNWINLYGAPVNNEREVTKLMNLNPDFASMWKGRVLIQVEHKETDKPHLKVVDMIEK